MKIRETAPLARSSDPGSKPVLAFVLLASAAIATAAPAAGSGPPGSQWTLRGHAAWVSPTDEQVASDGSIFSMDDGTGFGLDLEYRATRRLGIELGAFAADLDGRFRLDAGGLALDDTESIGMTSYSLGLTYHFAPGDRVDLHAGPFAAMSAYDDVIFLSEAGLREKRSFDDDYGFGLKVGIDVALRPGGAWALSASARYLLTILEAEESGNDLDLDPLILTAGLTYRF